MIPVTGCDEAPHNLSGRVTNRLMLRCQLKPFHTFGTFLLILSIFKFLFSVRCNIQSLVLITNLDLLYKIVTSLSPPPPPPIFYVLLLHQILFPSPFSHCTVLDYTFTLKFPARHFLKRFQSSQTN